MHGSWLGIRLDTNLNFSYQPPGSHVQSAERFRPTCRLSRGLRTIWCHSCGFSNVWAAMAQFSKILPGLCPASYHVIAKTMRIVFNVQLWGRAVSRLTVRALKGVLANGQCTHKRGDSPLRSVYAHSACTSACACSCSCPCALTASDSAC